jgi:hypothetical protein
MIMSASKLVIGRDSYHINVETLRGVIMQRRDVLDTLSLIWDATEGFSEMDGAEAREVLSDIQQWAGEQLAKAGR